MKKTATKKTSTKTMKTAPKATAKMAAKKTNGKFSILNEIHNGVLAIAQVAKSGEIKIKRAELKQIIEGTFIHAAKVAASGERVRFPVLGALVSRKVAARKAGKGINPFTKEEVSIKARPESKKPRWSFPKSVKETFADKKNW